MIQLYPKGAEDFSRNGIELAPQESDVNWQIAGRYDFSMSIPKEACEGITFDYGQILRVSVPPEHVDAINLGTVSYYTASEGTKLYSRLPKSVAVSYENWQALRSYMAGDKVTYDKKNWRCNTGHGGLSVPPPNGGLWTQIAGSRMDEGKTIATLASGTTVMKVRGFNSTYMEAATLTGLQGYVRIDACTATGESEERTVPAFNITEQLFTINKIDKETDKHLIRIEAEHISYQLGRTMLGECNVVGVNPATALRFIQGAMKEEYQGELYSGIDDGEITADWSWKNAQAAILDPAGGLLKDMEAMAIRDNRDVYIIPNPEDDAAKYEVRYGVNMKAVKWTGDVSGIVTRIYPIAQNEDGSRLTLPEEYIDSVLDVPYIKPEPLDTKLKVGQEIENSDGTKVKLTEDDVISRMREAAQNRFSIDKCDQAEVTLELDFVHMPDTEEYKAYAAMSRMAPGDWVKVNAGPMGVDSVIQLTEYVFDPIRLIYKRTGYGKKTQRPTVAGYSIKTGAVSGRTLAAGAVGSENIQAGAITAREIEAGSITAEQIASKIITTELLAAGAVTADEIAALAITTEKLAAGAVKAGKIDAGAVTSAAIAAGAITTDKLDAGAVTAAKIAAGTITADRLDAVTVSAEIARIANAQIQNADIGFAQIKALTTESLIARDAVTDRYFIAKLAVENAQMVHATVGDLVIKAADNNYYRLNIDAEGQLAPVQVTLTQGEITAGITSDGRGAIIETDLTVAELSASNMKGINALIDKITAQRIDVQELFARSAFIGALNTADISNNQSILIHINKKSANYIQWEDPNNGTNTINKGDIWEQRPDEGQTITDLYNYTIAELATYPIWAFMYGRQYMWNGTAWEIVQDNAKTTDVLTELKIADGEIRSSIISLGARMTSVETIISEDGIRDLIVEEMAEEVRQEIIDGAAGAAIDEILASKAAFVQWNTPQKSSGTTIRFGTLWLKDHGYRTIASCSSVTISTASNWTIESFDGGRLYMYAGTTGSYDPAYWRLVDDYGKTVTKTTELNRTTEGILARVSTVETSFVGVENRVSSLEMTDAQIEMAVMAAQATADNAYVRRAGILIDPDGVRLKATASDGGASLLDLLRTGIKVYSGGSIEIKAGAAFTVASGNFSIDASGNVTITGTIHATAGDFGGWNAASNRLYSGSGTTYVGFSSAADNVYAIWAGHETVTAAPFRVKRDGTVYMTKLIAVGESGSETEVNLRTAGLWKLGYHTIKRWTVSGGSVSIETTGGTINFNSAAGVTLSGGWVDNWTRYEAIARDSSGNVISTIKSGIVALMNNGEQATRANVKSALESSATHTAMISAEADGEDIAVLTIDASGVYNQGWAAAVAKVGTLAVTAGSGVVAITVPSATVGGTEQKSGTITIGQGSWSNGSKLVTAYFSGSQALATTVDVGLSSGWSAAYVQNGQMSVSCFVAGKAFSSGAMEDPGYKAGWNAYRAALVNAMGGKTNLAKSWVYRGGLYSMPQQGAQYYSECYNGLTFADIPDAM